MTKPLPLDHPKSRLAKKSTYTADIIALDQQGWTGRKIARHLGCSSGHVSQTLCRARTELKAPHSLNEKWERPTHGPTCREWVLTPEGLKPCGQPKHKLGGETMGQCHEHYEAQRPHAGRIAA